MSMAEISREHLVAYLDDALSDAETAKLEQYLRTSEPLRSRLKELMTQRDRGEHSLGAIWRRERLTCPTREQLGSYLLEVLEPELQDYLSFHLTVVQCPFCQANLADLREQAPASQPQAHERRRRYYQSSAGLLQKR
ncbi:MAG: hypothetical protein ACJ8C4_03865 [Gemmataceae bacterium]